jgi:hypothetical protein
MVWLGGSHVRHRSARRPACETAKDKRLKRDISGLASALSWVIVIGLSVAALWIAVSTTGTSLPMVGMWATLAALQLSQIPICRGMAYSAIGSCHINMAAALGMILLTALTFALINDHLSSTSTTETRRASAIITRNRDQITEVNSQVELLKKSIKRDIAAAEIIRTKRQPIKREFAQKKVQLDIYYEGKLAELLQSELSNQTLLSANEEMVRVLSQEIVEARASLNTGDGIYYRLADFFESAEKLPTNDGYMKVNILFFVIGIFIGIVNTALIYIAATIDLPNAVTTREQ